MQSTSSLGSQIQYSSLSMEELPEAGVVIRHPKFKKSCCDCYKVLTVLTFILVLLLFLIKIAEYVVPIYLYMKNKDTLDLYYNQGKVMYNEVKSDVSNITSMISVVLPIVDDSRKVPYYVNQTITIINGVSQAWNTIKPYIPIYIALAPNFQNFFFNYIPQSTQFYANSTNFNNDIKGCLKSYNVCQ